MDAIKTNTYGTSKLVLSYPIALRARAARMAKKLKMSQAELIRQGIEMIVSQYEAANPKPAKKAKKVVAAA